MATPSNHTPRISVNKLAEFMMAKAARQRAILYDQKYPTEFKGMYYKEAAEAVAFGIATNLEDISSIENAIKILSQQTPEKIGSQRRIASNIDALETFLLMLDDIDLKGASPKLGAQTAPQLTIHSVAISVRPEITLSAIGKSKTSLGGAMKLHFPKTYSLTTDSAGYVSALLQEWCRVHMPDAAVNGSLCPVLDVGSKTFFPGVKATAARMKDVEAICQNIAALWPTI